MHKKFLKVQQGWSVRDFKSAQEVFMELPISKLKLVRYEKAIPDLCKKDFDALKGSIEKWGIIEPIVVNQNNIIICGRERYRAALLLGMKKVPVVIRKTGGDSEIEDISQEENLRRRSSFQTRRINELPSPEEMSGNGKEMGPTRRKRRRGRKKLTTKPLGFSEKNRTGHYHTKLIPELSVLLYEGKIDQEAASLYATVSLDNQKKIFEIIKDKYSTGNGMQGEKNPKGNGQKEGKENQPETGRGEQCQLQ
jgi:ParB family chromosome partitioning protein